MHEAEEGGYWSEIPAIPGCASDGETIEEARANVIEAAQGVLLAQFKWALSRASDEAGWGRSMKSSISGLAFTTR